MNFERIKKSFSRIKTPFFYVSCENYNYLFYTVYKFTNFCEINKITIKDGLIVNNIRNNFINYQFRSYNNDFNVKIKKTLEFINSIDTDYPNTDQIRSLKEEFQDASISDIQFYIQEARNIKKRNNITEEDKKLVVDYIQNSNYTPNINQIYSELKKKSKIPNKVLHNLIKSNVVKMLKEKYPLKKENQIFISNYLKENMDTQNSLNNKAKFISEMKLFENIPLPVIKIWISIEWRRIQMKSIPYDKTKFIKQFVNNILENEGNNLSIHQICDQLENRINTSRTLLYYLVRLELQKSLKVKIPKYLKIYIENIINNELKINYSSSISNICKLLKSHCQKIIIQEENNKLAKQVLNIQSKKLYEFIKYKIEKSSIAIYPIKSQYLNANELNLQSKFKLHDNLTNDIKNNILSSILNLNQTQNGISRSFIREYIKKEFNISTKQVNILIDQYFQKNNKLSQTNRLEFKTLLRNWRLNNKIYNLNNVHRNPEFLELIEKFCDKNNISFYIAMKVARHEILSWERELINEEHLNFIKNYIYSKSILDTTQITDELMDHLPYSRNLIYELVRKEILKKNRQQILQEDLDIIFNYVSENQHLKIPSLCDELQKIVKTPRTILYEIVRNFVKKLIQN